MIKVFCNFSFDNLFYWGKKDDSAKSSILNVLSDSRYFKLVDSPDNADILHLWRCGEDQRKDSERLIDQFSGKKKIIVESAGTHLLSSWQLQNTDRILRKQERILYNEEEVKNRESILLNGSDIFRVPSVFSKLSFMSGNNDNNDKIIVRPFGYDGNIFNTKEKEASQSLSSRDLFKIGFFGRLRTRRGFHTFLNVCQMLSESGISAQFVACGEDRDGLDYARLSGFNFNLDYIIPETPYTMSEMMTYCDVVLSPCIESSFNVTTLEAMACGAFPIVSSNTGISYIIAQHAIGNIVNPYDIDLIFKNCLSCYNTWKKDKELFTNLTKRVARIVTNFSWNSFEESLKRDYHTVIGA